MSVCMYVCMYFCVRNSSGSMSASSEHAFWAMLFYPLGGQSHLAQWMRSCRLMMWSPCTHVSAGAMMVPFAARPFTSIRSCLRTCFTPKGETMENDLFSLWRLCQTYVHGAGVNLHLDCLPATTSKIHSSEGAVPAKDLALTLPWKCPSRWNVQLAKSHVNRLMLCYNIYVNMIRLQLFLLGNKQKLQRIDTHSRAMPAPSWLIGSGGQGDAPPARRQRVDPPAGTLAADNQRKLTLLLAKAVLKNAADIRELQSAVLTTLLIPKDTSVVSAMSSATQGHNTQAMELRKAGKQRDCSARGTTRSCLDCNDLTTGRVRSHQFR